MQNLQTSIELGVDLMKDIVAAGYGFLKEKTGFDNSNLSAKKS